MATIFDKYRNPDTYDVQVTGQGQPETFSGGSFNYAGMIGAFSQAAPSIMNSVSQYNAPIGDNAQYLGDYYVNAKRRFNKNTGILGGLGLLTFTDDISQDLANLENDTASRISAMKMPEATSLDDAMGKLSAFRKQDFSVDNIYSNKYARGFKTALKGAELGTSISPGWGTLIGGVAGSLTGIIGAERNNKMYGMAASAASSALRDKQRHVFAALQNNVSTMNTKNMQQQKATISAYGGPLGVSLNPVNNALDYMQNEELLSYMTDDLDSRNKKSSLPMFAFGGALGGYGGNWSNGLTFVKAGGSHERNPLGGVPMGMAQDGQPNLVEEGEVVWNHPILANGGYVFTKRHNIPKWLQDKYKLGNEPITYAAAVDKLQQAISERPNDPIEQKTLEAELAEFMEVQEEWRQEKEQKDQMKQYEYAMGGKFPKKKGKREKLLVDKHGYTSLGNALIGSIYGPNTSVAPLFAARNADDIRKSADATIAADAVASAIAAAAFTGASGVTPLTALDAAVVDYNIGAATGANMFPTLMALGNRVMNDKPIEEIPVVQKRVGIEYKEGGGLSRGKDYKSKKKPYPSVSSEDFAGGGRSYPIPTKADAIDALRLAGLHGRSDVKAKVYKKYPELKHALGGYLFDGGGYIDPVTGEWIETGNPMDDYRIQYPQARRPQSTIVAKPLPATPINQYVQPIYIEDNSPMNQYALATNPLTITNNSDLQQSSSVGSRRQTSTSSVAPTTPSASDYRGATGDLPTSGWQTGLRYAPILGGAIGLAHTLFNKPDYEYANELSNLADTYANQVGRNRITPRFLGDRLTYNPFDRIFYANELGAQQAGTNRAITNMGNANFGRTAAALMANNYANNVAMGKLFREGDEYNLAQRQKVAEFNRGTNQYNSEADLKAQMFNNESKDKAFAKVLAAKEEALKMKQAIDQARNASIMANATNLFQGLGDIGYEAEQRYWLNALANSDIFGTPNESMLDIAYGRRRHAANGGKLNKRKKGITI